jgi:hypothetical protein
MMTQPAPPKNILIVGGGSAGWMTASIFLQSLGANGSKITLIESANIPSIGVGEGTTPLFKRFLNFLNIPETEFMSACKATFKLGINFPGWTNSEEFKGYFHPFAAPAHNQYEQDFSIIVSFVDWENPPTPIHLIIFLILNSPHKVKRHMVRHPVTLTQWIMPIILILPYSQIF